MATTFVAEKVQSNTASGTIESLGSVMANIGENSKPFLSNKEMRGAATAKHATMFYLQEGQAANEAPYKVTLSEQVTNALRASIKAGKKHAELISSLLDLQIIKNNDGLQFVSFYGAPREFLTAKELKASYKASLEDLMKTV